MTGKIAPTAKVSSVGGSGIVITVALQLLQQYAPSLTLPSASTIAGIITILVTVAGWVTKEDPALVKFFHEPLPPIPAPVVSPEPVTPVSVSNGPVNEWGKD